MTHAVLPPLSPEPLPPLARGAVIVGVLALQAAVGWALARHAAPVRTAEGASGAIVVDMVLPPNPAPAPQPEPPALPRPPRLPRPQLAPPVVSVAAAAATPAPFAVPAPEAPRPPALEAPAAPPAPAPAPAAPRTLAATAVEYLTAPQLDYPPASRRRREQGQVRVRVLVGADGLPQQTQVLQSSGHDRLDEAALRTVRATRFKPYTENGVPQPFWVVMPLVFELEN